MERQQAAVQLLLVCLILSHWRSGCRCDSRCRRGCGDWCWYDIHRDDQNITYKKVCFIFHLIQVIFTPETVGFDPNPVNCAVKLFSQRKQAVPWSHTVFDQRTGGGIIREGCGRGQLLPGCRDEDYLSGGDETPAVKVVEHQQNFHINLKRFGNGGAVVALLDHVFKRH